MTQAAMAPGRFDYDACYAFHRQWEPHGFHSHDFYELYIHYSGAKCYCVDSSVYPIGANHLMVVPPLRMHGLLGDTDPAGYERAFVYITPAMLRTCGAGQMDLERFISGCVARGEHQFLMTQAEAFRCRELTQEMIRAKDSPAQLDRFAAYAALMDFLRIVCQVMERSAVAAQPIVVNEAMQEIISYINEHFAQLIRLESLARQFGVSLSFLSHEFVKYTGRSVYDYVLYRRMLLARELIGQGATLSDVAWQCGFNDYSSFLRVFRKMAGMSPTEYRHHCRAQK